MKKTNTPMTYHAKAWFAAIGVAIAILLVPAAAPASTIVFNDLGPGDSYEPYGNWFGYSTSGFAYTAVAGDFIPTGSGPFDELWIAIFHAYGENQVTLSLMTDNAGLPGTELWQQAFDDELGDYGSVFHVANINGPNLVAGTRYWIKATTVNVSGTSQSWYMNNQSDYDGLFAWQENGGPWKLSGNHQRHALRVGVVPEPSSLVLLGIGALALFGCCLRRSKRNR
jgi:hypothetical protein